ncbi:MAG: tRNA lysidine(34) synthetase TilS [Defluviitaleaceae bacterium]|nr:tRNA lysidine(34) synthetase TilS [Defluviitaleaceae bacterium]
MISKIIDTIKQWNMVDLGDRILLGLSGGMDSIVLLHILLEMRTHHGFEVCVVHIDHGLRGEESLENSAFCTKLCADLGVELVSFAEDVNGLAREWGMSIENAGRKVRYECFLEAAKMLDCNKIATAHNQNDSIENIFLSMLRGSGMAGFGGIPPIRPAADSHIKIIRPLINILRNEISAYCTNHNLEYREDSSNLCDNYLRNRIRNKLLPDLIRDYNPALLDTMRRSAEIIYQEDNFLKFLADSEYDLIVQNDEIFVDGLNVLQIPIKRRVIRKFLMENGVADPMFDHIESLISLALGDTGKEIHLPKNRRAVRIYDTIQIAENTQENPLNFCVKLPINEPIFVPEAGLWFYLGKTPYFSVKNNQKSTKILCTKALKYDMIDREVEIRTRRPGDVLYFNNVGTKKLSDYFIDNKIPRQQRERAIFAVCGNRIILMIGGFETDFFADIDGDNTIYLQIWEEML